MQRLVIKNMHKFIFLIIINLILYSCVLFSKLYLCQYYISDELYSNISNFFKNLLNIYTY